MACSMFCTVELLVWRSRLLSYPIESGVWESGKRFLLATFPYPVFVCCLGSR